MRIYSFIISSVGENVRNLKMQSSDQCAINWTEDDVAVWLVKKKFSSVVEAIKRHQIDGKALLLLNENDIEYIVAKNVSETKTRVIRHVRYCVYSFCLDVCTTILFHSPSVS